MMTSADYILAIDNGTQSVRALIFDPRGNLVNKVRVPITPYVSPRPGWAEQDPEYFWASLCQACQQLWQQTSVPKEAIAGVALTTQRSTIVGVDRDGAPLRPAIVWLDQRRTEGLRPVGGLWGAAFRLAGASQTVAYLQAEAEANWIRTHQPDVWKKLHKYLFLSGYLTYRLTGKFVDSVGSQVGYIPFDYKALTWAKPWDWKWRAVPMEKRLLPQLVPPAGQLGEITAEASAATGLPAGLPVIAAAADKACEVIGAGSLNPHIGCLSYGTTATINTTHKKYIEVIPLIPPYPSAVPGHYSLEVQIFRGYWMVSWFKEEFGCPEQLLADEQGVEPEALFDALVNQVPPDCATPAPKQKARLSALATSTHGHTFIARCWKGWPTPCARARSVPNGAAISPSPNCASPAAVPRATPRCNSPPTSSACRRRARTSTRPPAWARPSTQP